MELTFDGKGTVSGTLSGLPSPGEIRSGTFDPQTGALKLVAAPTVSISVAHEVDFRGLKRQYG